MSAVAAPPRDPIIELFKPVAAVRAHLFAGRNLIIGRSNIVHRAAMSDWLGVLQHPAPECHQGWSGFGLGTDLHPTVSPVTCLKCGPDVDGQLSFDFAMGDR